MKKYTYILIKKNCEFSKNYLEKNKQKKKGEKVL